MFSLFPKFAAIKYCQKTLFSLYKLNYYKLPGGGVEEGEDLQIALKRECKEEIGCNVEIIREVGQINEYRKMFNIKQISFCFLAKVVGGKGEPELTEGEK